MSHYDKGSAAPLIILGFMTASRRLRNAGGILGLLLLALGGLLWLTSRHDPDPTASMFPFFTLLIGGAFVFYWLVASVLSWFVRIAREDLDSGA